MASAVMVPLYLDALLLTHDQVVVQPTADFSRLPYVAPGQDANSDVANISEEIVARPFDDVGTTLRAGIHLHWALPDALTKATDTPDETRFPSVPNRWLVVRSRGHAGPSRIEKAWVVESDYVYPDGAAETIGSIAIPYPPSPEAGHYRPYRYQGRKLPLEAWPSQGDTPEYLPRLTAIGSGDPLFAAFYPNCRSVFGLHDDSYGTTSDLRYEVIGWYGDPAQDHYAEFLASQGSTDAATLTAALLDAFKWNLPLQRGQEIPNRMICYARLTFQPSGGAADDTGDLTIAIGNTGSEALSAYLAHQIDPNDKPTVEDQLEALLLNSRLDHRQLDVGAKFVEARHEKGFQGIAGGSLWSVRAESYPGTPASATDADTRSKISLPPDLIERLEATNLLQQRYDRALWDVESMRRQLFADWYRYMLCAYPPDDTRDDYPDADEVRYFVERTGLDPLRSSLAALGTVELGYDAAGTLQAVGQADQSSLAGQLGGALSDVLAGLTTFNAQDDVQAAKVTYTLRRIAAPRYWQPREPVVLLTGPAAVPTPRHGRLDPIDVQVMDLDPRRALIPDQIDQIRDHIDRLTRDASGDGPGLKLWKQQPWNSLSLEWEVEVFPTRRSGNLDPDSTAFQPDFISASFALPENQPDLAVQSELSTVAKAANLYSGTAILTPHASIPLANSLQEYLSDPSVDLTSDTSKRLKTAQDLLSASDFHCLSQALGGFNEALLMHRQTWQLDIADPLGFDDDQAFAQAVHDGVQGINRSAPQPLWDFNPIRSGALRLNRLRLVDTFGQVRDVDLSKVVVAEYLASVEGTDMMRLPPRLVQPARLSFRWLAADGDPRESHDHEGGSPICGWVLPNNLDSSLMVYDGSGAAVGIITRRAVWQHIPGQPPIEPDQIANPYLAQLVGYLLRQGEEFLSSFISALDTSLANIDPESFAQHQDLALLMGRPIALVRASLDLQIQGLPAVHAGWSQLLQDMQRTSRDDDDFPLVVFPVRLGEYQQLNDGLVGYWLEQEGGYADNVFYSPQSDPVANTLIKTHADDAAPLKLTLGAAPSTLAMLIDPRGQVHATSGVMPVKAIDIPPQQYAAALKAIEVLFLCSPILSGPDKVGLPLPTEPGFQWSWVGAGGSPADLGPASTQATFRATPSILEGWLRLTQAQTSDGAANGAAPTSN